MKTLEVIYSLHMDGPEINGFILTSSQIKLTQLEVLVLISVAIIVNIMKALSQALITI